MRTAGGKYRDVVAIESKATGADSAGQPNGNWSNFATLRANVRALTGAEKWLGDVSLGEITHNLQMRYYPGVTRKMRVTWGSKTLAIEAVVEDKKSGSMEIRCKEKL